MPLPNKKKLPELEELLEVDIQDEETFEEEDLEEIEELEEVAFEEFTDEEVEELEVEVQDESIDYDWTPVEEPTKYLDKQPTKEKKSFEFTVFFNQYKKVFIVGGITIIGVIVLFFLVDVISGLFNAQKQASVTQSQAREQTEEILQVTHIDVNNALVVIEIANSDTIEGTVQVILKSPDGYTLCQSSSTNFSELDSTELNVDCWNGTPKLMKDAEVFEVKIIQE